MATTRIKTIAIACQGGGAHVAFGAGVLKALMTSWPSEYRLIALTGTSGGAINAALVWYAFLKNQPQLANQLLDDFWEANSAQTFSEMLVNDAALSAVRLGEFGIIPMSNSVALFGPIAQASLRKLIKQHIPFSEIPALIKPGSPRLLISAIEVLSGNFHIFENAAVTLEALLASCAVPEIFPPVAVADAQGKTSYFWDGLYSENPPISGLLTPEVSASNKPDEIWVIQINPETRDKVPTYASEIADRKNELAGNLSINQAVAAVHSLNEHLHTHPRDKFKPIQIRRIALPAQLNLDFASKLDRSPAFIKQLILLGEQVGQAFIGALPAGNRWEASHSPVTPRKH